MNQNFDTPPCLFFSPASSRGLPLLFVSLSFLTRSGFLWFSVLSFRAGAIVRAGAAVLALRACLQPVRADGQRHPVKVEALFSRDQPFLRVVPPGGKQQELSFSTGIKGFPVQLLILCKAVLSQDDCRAAALKSTPHHELLAWRDRGGDKHRAILKIRLGLV